MRPSSAATSGSGNDPLSWSGEGAGRRRAPGFIRWCVALGLPLARLWFRPRARGFEQLPRAPVLLVGNHSGYGVFELLLMLALWTERFGLARPVLALSHDLGLAWPLRWAVERLGGIRASPDHAQQALREGFDVAVFPGGDVDVLRPFSARDEVRFGGRTGFLRVALERGTPIVPVVTCGSHAQYTMLPGGERLARWLHLERFRLSTWPLPLGFFGALLATALAVTAPLPGWVAWAAWAWALVPNPTRIEVQLLPAIDAAEWLALQGGNEGDAAEALRRYMEEALQAMARTRRTPWG